MLQRGASENLCVLIPLKSIVPPALIHSAYLSARPSCAVSLPCTLPLRCSVQGYTKSASLSGRPWVCEMGGNQVVGGLFLVLLSKSRYGMVAAAPWNSPTTLIRNKLPSYVSSVILPKKNVPEEVPPTRSN